MTRAFEAKHSPESRFGYSVAEVLKSVFDSVHCAGWQVGDRERCLEPTTKVINREKQQNGVLIQ
jgi:hypothetical protein